MNAAVLTGLTLVAGCAIFLAGAVFWKLSYERPLAEALPDIHRDRGRRQWIHLCMTAAMLVTPAGLAGFQSIQQPGGVGQVLAGMAFAVYLIGAVCMVVSLLFRLTVVPWAAGQTVETGEIPGQFPVFHSWAGALYCVHMVASYAAYAILGCAVLASGLPVWLGWLGIAWGAASLLGIVATRFAGPFNPPILAHVYTAVLGVVLLVS